MMFFKKLAQKAAMFGLDARIALAIFSSVSAISGAGLYLVIKTLDVNSFLYESNEIYKALLAYQTDTSNAIGPYDTDWATSSNIVDVQELVNSSVDGWQGPYISLRESSSLLYALHSEKFGDLFVYRLTPDLSRLSTTSAMGLDCSVNKCQYILMTQISGSLMSDIDKAVDSGDGLLTGLVQEKSGSLYYILGPAEYEGI